MINKLVKKQKGATILELLIYIALLVIVFVIIGESFTTIVLTRKKIEARKLIDENLDYTIKKIEESVKGASAITGSYPSDTLNLTIDGQTTSYSLSAGVLQKTERGITYDLTPSSVIVAHNGDFMFYKIENPLTNPTVQIKIKISYNSNDTQLQNIETVTQTTISLR